MRRWTRDNDHYRHGDFNVICDRSGFKAKASDTRMQWNGLRVRAKDFEQRHPQEFVRGVRDDQTVHNARPEAADRFISSPVTQDDL